MFPPLGFWIVYLGLGLVATIFELVRPARKLSYWAGDALVLDVVALFFVQLLVPKYAHMIRAHIPIRPHPWHVLHLIRFPVRMTLYFVLVDFGSYWMHRLTHTKYVWRVHHFHHSITQMYWLAGVRETVWQHALTNLPLILWTPLIFDARPQVFTELGIFFVLTNHWQHLNFTWRSTRLEYLFVTPRSHQVHHSASPEHYNANYGVVFSIWDRMFGTWVDPDTTTVTKLGAGEIENPVQAAWLMFGAFGAERGDFLRRNLRKLLPFF